MQFGSYPQIEVKDKELISVLNYKVGQLPSSINANSWTDYGYYINGSVSSYMWYIDVIVGGNKYRGVYFTCYRPYFASAFSSKSTSIQDGSGYYTNSVYWFKYEPITWRVIDVQNGKAFLMANLVLDSQDYHYSNLDRALGGVTIYANNYKESHIRSWLNNSFYNTAFCTEEKARIQTTVVDNSAASTGYNPNQYACDNTNDKVFLLSYVEATNEMYGLNTTISRQLSLSDYAKSQGGRADMNGFKNWWLRSPNYDDAINVSNVDADGVVYECDFIHDFIVEYVAFGVVPALWVSL